MNLIYIDTKIKKLKECQQHYVTRSSIIEIRGEKYYNNRGESLVNIYKDTNEFILLHVLQVLTTFKLRQKLFFHLLSYFSLSTFHLSYSYFIIFMLSTNSLFYFNILYLFLFFFTSLISYFHIFFIIFSLPFSFTFSILLLYFSLSLIFFSIYLFFNIYLFFISFHLLNILENICDESPKFDFQSEKNLIPNIILIVYLLQIINISHFYNNFFKQMYDLLS